MTCLTAAGIALERPQVVARLTPAFVAPLHAEQQATAEGEEGLPAYVPGGQGLSFKSDGKTDDSRNDADGSEMSPPAAGAEPVAANATAAPADIPEQAAPPSAPAAAAIAPVIIDNSQQSAPQRTAPVTIEPDPTARSTDGPPAPPLIPAKQLFGAAKAPAPLAARAIGTYARGCLAGAVALPVDGPAWQAMRLSRNRNWGHPNLVKLVETLALDSKKQDNWPGLLVGDISQPRGGPMLTGHASHQLGLDADVWLTPMPDKRLSRKEREELSATSMLDSTDLAVDPKVFTPGHVQLIKRAASYPEVERVLVHPAIKKALCEAA
ncbi:MAG: penicillin-insensitive murein endopeptidase, partial [Hyphomicrobium sp.]